jgi:hypothetical protein
VVTWLCCFWVNACEAEHHGREHVWSKVVHLLVERGREIERKGPGPRYTVQRHTSGDPLPVTNQVSPNSPVNYKFLNRLIFW